jgi:NitT/TauT family transport system ATP-binding protein
VHLGVDVDGTDGLAPLSLAENASLEIDGVRKVFRRRRNSTEVTAIERTSLSVEDGEFVSILGPSGCGKSTLLRIVAGLLEADTGTVRVRGSVVKEPSRHVGMMYQQPVLLPWRTVMANIMLPVEILGLNRAPYKHRANELIELAGLGQFVDRYPNELSGGMQQRVAFCRLLTPDPSVLLMDEPFGALDALTREEVGFALLNIWDHDRKTVVFVTHSIQEAVVLSDRVVVMSRRPGRVIHEVRIDIDRPRTSETESSARCMELSRELRCVLASGEGTRRR